MMRQREKSRPLFSASPRLRVTFSHRQQALNRKDDESSVAFHVYINFPGGSAEILEWRT